MEPISRGDDAGSATLSVSKSPLRTIMDQLQRLNKNGDDHDQLIHDLQAEVSSLKPQVEILQLENATLKEELGKLKRGQVAVGGVGHGAMRHKLEDSKEEVKFEAEVISDSVSPSSISKSAEKRKAEVLAPTRTSKRLRVKKRSASPATPAQPHNPSPSPKSEFESELSDPESEVLINPPAANQPNIKIIPGKKTKPSSPNALCVPPSLLTQHLLGTSTLSIHPPPLLSLKIALPFLSKEYGAATQALLWSSPIKGGSSVNRKFIYPGVDTNPDAPAAPGEPGILLSARTEMTEGIWSLFIRVLSADKKESKLKRWTYAGEYESAVVGSLSPSQFQSSSANVKQTWGKKIAYHKKHPCYVEMRARMSLRKEGREVTDTNVEEEKMVIKKTPKEKSKLSVGDVVRAFEAGDEVIPIIQMQCTSYNHDFARELLSKYKASGKI